LEAGMGSQLHLSDPQAAAVRADAVEQRDLLVAELESFCDLHSNISLQKSSSGGLGDDDSEKLVHLGAEVFAKARVHDPKTVFMYVGLGFYVQCSLDESLKLAEDNIQRLQQKKALLDQFLQGDF